MEAHITNNDAVNDSRVMVFVDNLEATSTDVNATVAAVDLTCDWSRELDLTIADCGAVLMPPARSTLKCANGLKS